MGPPPPRARPKAGRQPTLSEAEPFEGQDAGECAVLSRRVHDDDLAQMHLRLSAAIRKREGRQWLEFRGEALIEGHDLIALLDELRQRRKSTGRTGTAQLELGHITKVLMAMKVWEKVEIEPITKGALTNCRTSARKHMQAPDAVWHSQTLDNGLVLVTRMPNGSPIHAKYHNRATYELAAMKAGDVILLTSLKGKMHNGIKIHARKIMDNSEAQWRCENMASGNVRATRTR